MRQQLNELTARQRHLFEYLCRRIRQNQETPSLRTIASDLGISHTAVASLLHSLQDKGWIRRDGRYSRRIVLQADAAAEQQTAPAGKTVPIIGRVAAGLPLYAQQEWAGTLLVDPAVFRGNQLFALRVQGDSMRNAGILAGDLAICEPRQFAANGEIVVALING